MPNNIIFLDIDGVLNHQFKTGNYSQSERFGLAQDLVDNLKYIIDSVDNVKIVISSSWRSFRIHEDVSKTVNWRCILEDMLSVERNSIILGDLGMAYEFNRADDNMPSNLRRSYDIKNWLNCNDHNNFVILDDECSGFKKLFPNNYVDCDINSNDGLTKKRAKEAIWILTDNGKDFKMDNHTFFISDTHFSHGNIISYCNRPWNLGKDENGIIKFDDECIEKMNNALIENWNSVVGKDDIVWHLGDFALGPNQKENIPNIVSKLNGKINLVMGNHDHHSVKFYYDAGFNRVYDRPVIINKFIILSHAPVDWVKDGSVWANLYGHVHNQEMYKKFTTNTYNCCVEVNGYKPVSFKEIYDTMTNVVN